jgi:hypothetical protein
MAPTLSYRTLDLAGAGVPVIDLDGAQDGPAAGRPGPACTAASTRRWPRCASGSGNWRTGNCAAA